MIILQLWLLSSIGLKPGGTSRSIKDTKKLGSRLHWSPQPSHVLKIIRIDFYKNVLYSIIKMGKKWIIREHKLANPNDDFLYLKYWTNMIIDFKSLQ